MMAGNLVKKLLFVILYCYVVPPLSKSATGFNAGLLPAPPPQYIMHHQSKCFAKINVNNANEEISDKPRWILVVEDEDSLRNAVGKYLSKEGGYYVTGVADAQSALLVCRGLVPTTRGIPSQKLLTQDSISTTNNSTTHLPDCLILDIQLNGPINGLDLLKIIRSDELLASLPVVLLTAKGKVEDRILGYKAGADAYLPKPFDPDELISIINGLTSGNTIDYSSGEFIIKLKRELEEIKALLNDDPPATQSRVSLDSLYRDILDIKGTIQTDVVDTTTNTQSARQYNQYNSILTPDETTIINFISDGMINKDIATEMDCSVSKVEKRITLMFKKAGVHNRGALVDWWSDYSKTLGDLETPTQENITTLTSKEKRVIELLESGMTTDEIISETKSTKAKITKQLDSLMKKAGVDTRTELVRWWRDN
jgi:DNA-binding NarL/FixJ family response regulator